MNEPNPIEPTTHQQATLLPWYLADTLNRDEKLEVEAHLADCETCQMELDEMKHTRAAVKAAVSEREGPSPAVLTKVMARIREESASTQQQATPIVDETPGIWAQVETWLQSIFAVPWVPVLATALIVGQSALLLTNLDNTPGSFPPIQGRGPIIERGIPTAPMPAQTSRLQVSFAEKATQKDMQTLLRTIHAQIISGPTEDGVYILELSTTNSTNVKDTLETLLAQPAIIRSATSTSP